MAVPLELFALSQIKCGHSRYCVIPRALVTLNSGSYTSLSATLSGGNATFSVPAGSLAVESDTLTVDYTPDGANSSTYTAASGTEVVSVTSGSKSTSIVAVTPSSSSITTSQSLTGNVTVAGGSGAQTATDSVMLSSGTYTSAPAPLSGRAEAMQRSIFPPDRSLPETVLYDTVAVAYSGDANFASATGSAVVRVTTAATAGSTISSTNVSVGPGAITSNTSTITLTPSGGFTGSIALTASISSSPSDAQNLPTQSFGSTSPVNIKGTET